MGAIRNSKTLLDKTKKISNADISNRKIINKMLENLTILIFLKLIVIISLIKKELIICVFLLTFKVTFLFKY